MFQKMELANASQVFITFIQKLSLWLAPYIPPLEKKNKVIS